MLFEAKCIIFWTAKITHHKVYSIVVLDTFLIIFSHMFTYINTHTHACTYTQKYTHMLTHTHTHTHTHSQSVVHHSKEPHSTSPPPPPPPHSVLPLHCTATKRALLLAFALKWRKETDTISANQLKEFEGNMALSYPRHCGGNEQGTV